MAKKISESFKKDLKTYIIWVKRNMSKIFKFEERGKGMVIIWQKKLKR